MKTTGMTRRIDDLGRIVIPKEIRKNLHIKEGETLEIFLENDSVILKKHSIINENNSIINSLIDIISKKTKSNIYITNLDKILFSSVKNNDILNKDISQFLETVISFRGIFSETTKKEIQLTSDEKDNGYYEIKPISPNGDLEGMIIFVYKQELDENQILFIDFFSELLQLFFEK